MDSWFICRQMPCRESCGHQCTGICTAREDLVNFLCCCCCFRHYGLLLISIVESDSKQQQKHQRMGFCAMQRNRGRMRRRCIDWWWSLRRIEVWHVIQQLISRRCWRWPVSRQSLASPHASAFAFVHIVATHRHWVGGNKTQISIFLNNLFHIIAITGICGKKAVFIFFLHSFHAEQNKRLKFPSSIKHDWLEFFCRRPR